MQPPASDPVSPYAPPRSDTSVSGDPGGGGGDLTQEEIYAFVDENVGYYRDAWAQPNRTGGFYAGFNFPALLVSTLWLLYRKMYLAFAVFFVAQLAAIVAGAVAAAVVGVELVVGGLGMLVLSKVALGFLGNGLYLRRARRVVRQARLISPGQLNAPYLAARGGTSTPAVVVGLLVNVAVNLLLR